MMKKLMLVLLVLCISLSLIAAAPGFGGRGNGFETRLCRYEYGCPRYEDGDCPRYENGECQYEGECPQGYDCPNDGVCPYDGQCPRGEDCLQYNTECPAYENGGRGCGRGMGYGRMGCGRMG